MYIFLRGPLTPISLGWAIYRSEGFPQTGYFFPAHGGWGNDNSEKFFSARRRRRPLEGVPGEYAQNYKNNTQNGHSFLKTYYF